MGDSFEFDEVDVFTTGAIGRPGERTFYLQARLGRRDVSLKCEKQQVAALVDYLKRLLRDLPPPTDRPLQHALELVTPDVVTFVVGPMGLAYDGDADRFVLTIEEVVGTDEEGEPDPESLAAQGRVRLRVSRGQAAAFVEHGEQVVAAGRPACIFCGQPVDPDGHPCPRMN